MRKFIQTVLTFLSVLIPFACFDLGPNFRYLLSQIIGDEAPLFDYHLFIGAQSVRLALSSVAVASVLGIYVLLIFQTSLRRLFRHYELVVRRVTYDPCEFQPLKFNISVVLLLIAFIMIIAGPFSSPALATRVLQFVYWPITTITFINEIALLGAVVVMGIQLLYYRTNVVCYMKKTVGADGDISSVIDYCTYKELDQQLLRDCRQFEHDVVARLRDQRRPL